MRHNDYPTTLLMEPAANDEPARYRMTPAASTVRFKREDPTSAELAAAEDYWHACHMFEHMAYDMPPAVASFHPGDPPMGALAEVWHTEAPPVPGFYLVRDYFRRVEIREKKCFVHWNGVMWTGGSYDLEQARRNNHHDLRLKEWQWLRLIEADTPAPAALPSVHFVCIRSHKGANDWKVGEVAILPRGLDSVNEPDNWRPCDSAGWIPHQPTADAVCPVPEDVRFEARWPDGGVSGVSESTLRASHSAWTTDGGGSGGLRAWRPIQS